MAEKWRVFCLEEPMWDDDLTDRESVLPVLELLERFEDVEFVHRHAATRAEFNYYLAEWRSWHKQSWSLLYLAYHGDKTGLEIGRDQKGKFVTLSDLAEAIGPARNLVVHLGSCRVLKASEANARAFLRATKARGLSGFNRDVEYIDSAAFDLLLLNHLAWYSTPGQAYGQLKKAYPDLCKRLGFVGFTNTRS